MPPAASGISSSYLPRRDGSPLPWLRLARRRSFHSEVFKSSKRPTASNDLRHVRVRYFDVPASIMCDTRNVGAAVELRSSRSLATRSIRLRIWSKFAAIVTSLTGNVSSPFSIQKPARRARSRR